MPQTVLKYDVEVSDNRRVELTVPFPAGTHVVVFVIEEPDNAINDLASASQSSLGFWDNPLDDEDWNNKEAVTSNSTLPSRTLEYRRLLSGRP